jgi:hypothetical protein
MNAHLASQCPIRPAGAFAVLAGMVFFFAAGSAMADELSGYMDFLYSRSEGRSGDVGGTSQDFGSEAFRQQYRLTLTKRIFPSLTFLGGGTVEKSRSTTDLGGTDSTLVSTAYRPFFDLTLRSPFVTAGAGYTRQQTTAGATDGPLTTLIQDRYYATAGWQQERLPSLALRWDQRDFYDRGRTSSDQTSESLTFTTRYEPLDNLLLRYERGVYDTRDNILGAETRTQTSSGRVDYSDSWIENRLALFTSYAVSRRKIELVSSETGFLDLQVFAFNGLYAADDTPLTGALDPVVGLIDGDTVAGTGITIGLPVTVPGARNLGLDLGSATTTGILAVWVNWNNDILPTVIANSFTWDVYSSGDNLNWTLVAANVAAVFDPFRSRFELSIPAVTARYVKVVVDPLTLAEAQASPEFAAAADQQIHVTELQAFQRTTPEGPVVSTTKTTNASFRALLLERPQLAYDMNYTGFRSEGPTTTRQTTLSNGLSASHRFHRVVAGTARVARMDSSDPHGDMVSYITHAGLSLTPLPVLSHTIAYSGRYSYEPELETVQHAVYLTNTAAVFRGVDLSASGGASHGRDSTGLKTDSTSYQVGTTIIPRSNLSFNQSYGATSNELYGSVQEPRTDTTRRGDLSVAYTPLETLYLTASWGWVTQSGLRHDRVQSYGANWSPFRGGALQLSVLYSEDHRSTDDSLSKLLTSGARWNISHALFLTATMSRAHTTSALLESRSATFATELRLLF